MTMTTGTTATARPATVASAWAAGLVMLLLGTSVVGLVVTPLAVPAAVYAATRRGTPWTVRVPLVLGAVALTALAVLWLLDGAVTGTTMTVESS